MFGSLRLIETTSKVQSFGVSTADGEIPYGTDASAGDGPAGTCAAAAASRTKAQGAKKNERAGSPMAIPMSFGPQLRQCFENIVRTSFPRATRLASRV